MAKTTKTGRYIKKTSKKTTFHGLQNFFNPKTVAVIGASNKKGKVGYSLIRNLKQFKGKVYPINKKQKKIQSLKAYSSVLDVKQSIDLAVIAVPALAVKDVLKECIRKKIKNIIISSAGFSESGNKNLENELLSLAKGKCRILGPNCFGIVNTEINLDTSFSVSKPKKGKISFVSQSGALWAAVADWSLQQGFGFSKFASLGNMSDIDFSDMIEILNNDNKTKSIVCYIELLKKGKKFMHAAKKSKKPIIAIKAGQSKAGTKAALSHTGSLAGSYEIYRAAFKQSNVILAETLTQAFDIARFFEEQEKPKGKRTLILTNAGGPGALAADYLENSGLDIVKIPKKTIKILNSVLSGSWSHNNPIDIIGDAKSDRYEKTLSILAKENFYDILLLLLTPQEMTEIQKTAEALVRFRKNTKKTALSCFMGGISTLKTKTYLESSNIPCFFELKRAADILSKISVK